MLTVKIPGISKNVHVFFKSPIRIPLDTERKLNVYKTFNVLYTLNLHLCLEGCAKFKLSGIILAGFVCSWATVFPLSMQQQDQKDRCNFSLK